MSRRRVIWLTIFGLMLFGHFNGRVDFGGFLLLCFIGYALVKMFDPDEEPAPAAVPKDATIEEDEPDPQDVIRIRRRSVELLRNSLMRHHNSRGTDQDYQASAASKETTLILQTLNAALAKKPAAITTNRHAHQ